MIWVGLILGVSYVNTFYNYLNDRRIEISQKELAMNIQTFFSDIAQICTTCFALVINKTIFSID